MDSMVSALRVFFTQVLDPPDLARKLSTVLGLGEIARLLDATTCLKHQPALSLSYSMIVAKRSQTQGLAAVVRSAATFSGACPT